MSGALRLVLVLAGLFVPAASLALPLDLIEDGSFLISVGGSTIGASQTTTGSPANILGAEREVSLVLPGTTDPLLGAVAQTTPSNDTDTFVDAIAISVIWVPPSPFSFSFVYDGVGSTGLGGVDLSGQGALVATVANQGTEGTLQLSLSGGGGSGTLSLAYTGLQTSYSFSLLDPVFSGVELSSIDSVIFGGDVTAPLLAGTLSVESLEFTAVPEPSTGVLVAFGLVLVARHRRDAS